MQKRATCHVGVVEDDSGLCSDLVEFLQLRGFQASGFGSGEAFLAGLAVSRFDLLILDVALPGMSGFDIAQRIRRSDATGIVMLTALDSDEYQVHGLAIGADAYLSKRSSLELIEATCVSVLRRLNKLDLPVSRPVSAQAWYLDFRHWRLTCPGGVVLELTQTEVTLLAALFQQPGESIARENLLALLEKPESLSNLRNLDNAASRLRRKAKQASGLEFPLRPSYGKGYTFAGECGIWK
ncbi:response regulator transcription factor [uncultured Azonexus sp.]|uniref:response regulator transcription factor n=1 Tax=uncultured Azonexus sp. TaxID=520307 RepID=UPI0026065D2E|nr:response regulator transcription factor [uncultured Azonexus sp.]